LPARALAQPTVSGVSGTIANGQTITIAGSSFGTKSTAGPLVWEDFNDGSLNGLAAHGGMSLTNSDNLRHPFSAHNARANFKITDANGDGNYFSYDNQSAPKWFVQYWVKLASNWHWGTSTYGGSDDGLANVKVFRLFPMGSRTYSDVGYSLHGMDGGDMLRFVENGVETYLNVDARPWFATGVWHNVQVQYSENSGVDRSDGTMRLWIDGVLRDSTTTLVTNVGSDGSAVNKRPYIIGFFDSWPASDASVSNMYAYYSDIYVDNTWARVELGDASTYGACKHREMQVPTAWGSGSISVRVAQGSFTSGQTAYLFVTDASGNVSSGRPVTIGGGAPVITAPAAPANVKIIK
jgi:hypothetical protein